MCNQADVKNAAKDDASEARLCTVIEDLTQNSCRAEIAIVRGDVHLIEAFETIMHAMQM